MVLALGSLVGAGGCVSNPAGDSAFGFETEANRVLLLDEGRPIGEFVFRDDRILRPYLANLRAPGGTLITRNQPPAEGDLADHPLMHPGVWFGFSRIDGEDFWRNKGRIEHLRFSQAPGVRDGVLSFATSSRLIASDGSSMATQELRVSLGRRDDGYVFDCEVALRSDSRELRFGDEEELGFGVRLATPLIERHGGSMLNADALRGAKAVWGKVSPWCAGYREIDGRFVGAAVFASDGNPYPSWWHARDYGLIVGNAFGARALPAASEGTLVVPRGETLRLRYRLVIFDAAALPDLAAFSTHEERHLQP